MSKNPHFSSNIQISELAHLKATAVMPKEAYYALYFLWAIWLISVSISLGAVIKQTYVDRVWPPMELWVGLIVGAGIPAILNWLTMKAYSWARGLTMLLLMIGIASNPKTISQNLEVNLPVALLGICTLIFQVAAISLLFSKPVSNWFKLSKEVRNAK